MNYPDDFVSGQKVVCIDSNNLNNLEKGKTYTVGKSFNVDSIPTCTLQEIEMLENGSNAFEARTTFFNRNRFIKVLP